MIMIISIVYGNPVEYDHVINPQNADFVYHLNNVTGQPIDSINLTNMIIPTAGLDIWVFEGRFNKGLNPNGYYDRVAYTSEFGHNLLDQYQLSGSAWIYKDSSSYSEQFAMYGNAGLGYFNNYCGASFGVFSYTGGDNACTGHGAYVCLENNGDIVKNEWVHVAWTIDLLNNNHSIYINGVLNNTGTKSDDICVYYDEKMAIGGRKRTNPSQTFKGMVDEVIFSNGVWSAIDVFNIYNGTSIITNYNIDIIDPLNSSIIYENTLILPRINYTIDDVTISLAECNFTINDNLSETMIYNSSTGYYEFNEYDLYFNVGNNNILFSCDETTKTEYLTVYNIPLISNISSINNILYSLDMLIESSDTTNITTQSSGDTIINTILNVSMENGTFIKSVNTNNIILNYSELYNDNRYKIDLTVTDDENIDYNIIGYFILNDTISPYLMSYYPSNDNTTQSEINTSHALDMYFIDLNLYAYEVKIYNELSQLKYTFNATNLESQSEHLTESLFFDSIGLWTIKAIVTDSHTKKKIKDYDQDIDINNKEIKFKFNKKDNNYYDIMNNVTITDIGNHGINNIETIKLKDRYKFKFSYNLNGNQDIVQHRYKIKCQDIKYIEFSEYIGHFVCPVSENWIDFMNPDIIDYDVARCGDDCFSINLNMYSNPEVIFESIGGLNTYAQDYIIEVIPEIIEIKKEKLFHDFDLSKLENVALLFLLTLIYFGALFIGYAFKNPIFLTLGLIFGIVIGLILINVHYSLMITMVLINIMLFFAKAKS